MIRVLHVCHELLRCVVKPRAQCLHQELYCGAVVAHACQGSLALRGLGLPNLLEVELCIIGISQFLQRARGAPQAVEPQILLGCSELETTLCCFWR